MMNTPPNSGAPVEEIPQGTVVNDVSKVKVGTVTFSALRDGFFVVEKGWLFTHQLYLPATAILAHDSEGITLRLSKEELKQDQWKQPPDGSMNDAMTEPPAFPNSPLPESGLAEDASPSVLPPDGVRPLAGESIPFGPPDEGGMRLLPPDEGSMRLLPPDEGSMRLLPPDEGSMRLLPPDQADMSLLPPDEGSMRLLPPEE